ncbi:hypothetical protein GCM10027521_05610 [Amycolatopsis cihanbeyliensis]
MQQATDSDTDSVTGATVTILLGWVLGKSYLSSPVTLHENSDTCRSYATCTSPIVFALHVTVLAAHVTEFAVDVGEFAVGRPPTAR